MNLPRCLTALLAVTLAAAAVHAADKKIVFIAGKPSHGWGAHEHKAGCMLLAEDLNAANIGVKAVVLTGGWPSDESVLDDAAAIVMYCDGGGGHMANAHLGTLEKLAKKGVGIGAIHYAVEVPKGQEGDAFVQALGGYFEPNWSVNPHWTADYKALPDHPVARGVKPFAINDEWYYHMRFAPDMKGVTPILTDVPGPSTLTRKDGPHEGNPDVRKAVERKEPQHMMWVYDRPQGGRSFGFTGGHSHWNWASNDFRKVVLNAIAWTAGVDVPAAGVVSRTPTAVELEANQDEPKPAAWKAETIQKMIDGWNAAKPEAAAPAGASGSDPHSLVNATAGLDVAEGLAVGLFAGEPMMLNPTGIDVDDRGRVWVAEVVNYRAHQGTRPAGDRILILEDTDGDGRADSVKVFYQGSDIDSAHGVTVVGDKVYVPTALSKLFVFTKDANDNMVSKELLFQGHEGPQHDHTYHTVHFGPDGKLYWNMGNASKEVRDAAGNFVYDVTGTRVTEKDKPYREGMVFRLNPDGSQLQVMGWNFRNNWEVNVDSFGTMWQSDNDDDGNRGVRINYVMPYGNYGYTDEMTGAGWRVPRTNMEAEIPLRHWHLNDPGVVPNLLQTGAGSPTGICVYEGTLLPKVYWGQIIHCDAGPNVVRAYPVKKSGAGYTAEMLPILTGTRDKWFRPSDVCVAPDGSLIIADWYDPGVGGHKQGDLDHGRLFRVAPPGPGSAYKFPKADYATPEGAVEALKSPNQATQAKAWMALHAMGAKAEPALTKLWASDNPRFRARALYLLALLPDGGKGYLNVANGDPNPDIRITRIRIAVNTGNEAEVLSIVSHFKRDPDPQVRRECALALRFIKSPEADDLWAALAGQHDGKDRWYLEAMGIGADLTWNTRFAAFESAARDFIDTPGGRDIIWRARTDKALPHLAKLITDPSTTDADQLRYFRAFDFHTGPAREATLTALLTGNAKDQDQIAALALKCLKEVNAEDPPIKVALERALKAVKGSQEFVDLVTKFNLSGYNEELMQMALSSPDGSAAVAALQQVMKSKGRPLVVAALNDEKTAVAAINVIGLAGDNKNFNALLEETALDAKRPVAVRIAVVRAMGRSNGGVKSVLELAKAGKLPSELEGVAADVLFASPKADWRDEAAKYIKMPGSGSGKPLPPIKELASRTGNAANGQAVFQRTCTACHKVNNVGIDFGPDLSEIGTKLPKEDIYVAILNPSAGISFGYEGWTIKKRDGGELLGYIASETEDGIALRMMGGITMKIAKPDIAQRAKQDISLMTPGLQLTMSEQEFVDMVEFLSSLKKAAK